MTNRITEDLYRLQWEHHDSCLSCNYKFQDGDTSHLGYGESNEPLYLCDKCAYKLKETAARYVFLPRFFETPSDNSNLWRYLDFTKYVSLLSNRGLYFARADQLKDIFEGAKGIISDKQKWDNYYLKFFRSAIKNPPKGYTNKLSEKEVEAQTKRLLKELEAGGNYNRKSTYINCWHENDYESEAMWRLYSSFIDNAIAIKTTYKRLYESLGKNAFIEIGRVKYIDYSKEFASINNSFWCKRKSFEHEKEVRAIKIKRDLTDSGIMVPCDINNLIEAVYVSPTSPNWFIDQVNDVNGKYGLNLEVKHSELTITPFY